ncbi:MAG: hypothetical protein AAGB34_04875 [Planctomycetota bacterium]
MYHSLSFVGSMLVASAAVAIPVTLTVTPTPTENTLSAEVTVTVDTPETDTQPVNASGTVEIDLAVDYFSDEVIAEASGIQFTGGRLAFSDAIFNFGSGFSTLRVTTQSVSGFFATPSGMLENVSNNMFDATLHTFTGDQGNLLAESLVFGNVVFSQSIDLATEPFTSPGPEGGVGIVSLTFAGDTPDGPAFDVVLTLDTNVSVGPVSTDVGNLTVTATADISGELVGRGTVVLPPALCAGDANGDGTVNVDDFINVLLNFGADTSALSQSERQAAGDANANGTIDVADFIAVLLNFGTACE